MMQLPAFPRGKTVLTVSLKSGGDSARRESFESKSSVIAPRGEPTTPTAHNGQFSTPKRKAALARAWSNDSTSYGSSIKTPKNALTLSRSPSGPTSPDNPGKIIDT